MRRAAGLWTRFSDLACEALYPSKCALCRLLGDSPICPACLDGFIPVDLEFNDRIDDAGLAFRAVVYKYEDRAAQAVRRLKYNRSTSLAPFMASQIRSARERLDLDAELVAPVPIHWSRRCSRGFNQAELLCGELDWRRGVLARVRRTRPQVGLTREERARNLEGAFWASPAVAGRSVLLVDDVLTSGQTARECAKALLTAGATEVGILAFCGET